MRYSNGVVMKRIYTAIAFLMILAACSLSLNAVRIDLPTKVKEYPFTYGNGIEFRNIDTSNTSSVKDAVPIEDVVSETSSTSSEDSSNSESSAPPLGDSSDSSEQSEPPLGESDTSETSSNLVLGESETGNNDSGVSGEDVRAIRSYMEFFFFILIPFGLAVTAIVLLLIWFYRTFLK